MTQLTTINNKALISKEVSLQIAHCEKQIKEIKKREEDMKKALLQAMKDNNVKKYEDDNITVTYVDGYDKESFNQNKFREEHSDMYDEYIEMKPVKESIRIKVNA